MIFILAQKYYKKIFNNAYVFSVIAKIISVATGLLYSILYSRYMKPELRGVGAVVTNYAEILMLVLCFGVYQGYPYFKKKADHSIYSEYINLISGMFICYAVTGALLIAVFRPEIKVGIIIAIVPLMFATKTLNYVVLIENPQLRNSAQIWIDVFDILFVLILLLFTEADFSICMLYIVIKEAVCFCIAVANLKYNILLIRPSLKLLVPYIKFGIVPMVTVIMMEINYRADVLMLEYFEVSKAQIGIYTLGVGLAQKIWLIPDALKDILLSNLAKGKNEKEVCKITRISLAVMMVFVLLLLIFGKPIVPVLYGSDYNGTYEIMLILIAGIIGMVFYKMIYSYNVIFGHKNINLLFLGMAALVNVGVNAIVIPPWGIYGAGLASTASYLMCGVAFLVYFCRKTGIPYKEMLVIQKDDIATMKCFLKK